jgi:hypothetical protein
LVSTFGTSIFDDGRGCEQSQQLLSFKKLPKIQEQINTSITKSSVDIHNKHKNTLA